MSASLPWCEEGPGRLAPHRDIMSKDDPGHITEMSGRVPEIRPISDLVRDARRLIARARERQEPIVITQRGRDAAVIVPIELYRRTERMLSPQLLSPRLVRPEDAEKFRMDVTVVTTTQRRRSSRPSR